MHGDEADWLQNALKIAKLDQILSVGLVDLWQSEN
jgi:hypothetical protein